MEIDRDGLEVLDRAECLRLLGGAAVARIAGSSGALPVVLPLRYAFDGDSVVFESVPGTTIDFMTSGAVVAFEVDNMHERGHCSWTVMVTGVARPVSDDLEIERRRRLLPEDAARPRFLRLSLDLVSGRRTRRTHRHARSRAAARPTERVG
jgi:uncharacterized protein